MKDLNWIFDGIGTELISVILGLIIGGFAGYKIGIHKSKINQRQKANDNASQIQIGINNGRK